MAQPHDQLVRAIFTDPAHAEGELRTLLPAALTAALDWSALEVVSGPSYVDETLQERQLDLLYRVPIAGAAEPALIYLLFEHQSTVDPLMAARLLIYCGRVLDQWLREHPGARQIPLLVPLVLHHSRTGWTAPTRLLDLVALPDAVRTSVRSHVPDFTFLLDDLARVTDAELHARAMSAAGRLVLSALRFGRDPAANPDDLVHTIALLAEVFAAGGGHDALRSVFRYLSQVRDDDLIEVLAKRTEDHQIEDFTMSYRQRLIDQGRKEGREEGREGARDILRKLLLLKFGELDAETEQRLQRASLGELTRWSDRVLDAPRLAEVFADDPS
jgi:predicted transposase YdaD